MLNQYVLYLTDRNSGDVILSRAFSSFGLAKDNIDDFLKSSADKLGKKLQIVSKDVLGNLKSDSKPGDFLYAVKKENSVTLFHRITCRGRFFNSYSIEKYGKIGINEFSIPVDSIQPHPLQRVSRVSLTKEEDLMPVPLYSSSSFSSSLSSNSQKNLIKELKDKMSPRTQNEIHDGLSIDDKVNSNIVENQVFKDKTAMEKFTDDLKEGKTKLKKVVLSL